MIRLPSNHASITAPLVASNAAFPGIEIGRSTTDGRPFHLSPVLVDDQILPSTNSLTLGGLGSGKSTSRKVQIRREIRKHAHQVVVIDSYGEQQTQSEEGEWAPLTRDLNGQVIAAGEFSLNPLSTMFPTEVREQLVRSLITAVEPDALTPQAGHALQHALSSPKASELGGLVDALLHPEDGRWTADKLKEWGEGAAIALDRYTEGSLKGLFDGPTAGLPETDLPIISFDFTRLDRNSPAIPALMAAISCWVEHVWLKQSTAVHRHLVIEEAWQILLNPVTAELIQRLLKNSRKAALSVDAVMHTLSDLGDGRALDLASLCEIIQIGRLSPDEALKVGTLFELPAWVIEKISTLLPGQAVWKIGSDFIDIIKTVITPEEAHLTDTSTRRRKAQQTQALDVESETEPATAVILEKENLEEEEEEFFPLVELDVVEVDIDGAEDEEAGWGWELPPTVVDTCPPLDTRHYDVLQAAVEGRLSEAANLAAIGERDDITAHGLNSDQAAQWLATRAKVADLSGNSDQAAHLRATVTRMGNEVNWWNERTDDTPSEWHHSPQPPMAAPTPDPDDENTAPGDGKPRRPRRTWASVAVIAALALTTAVVWQNADDKEQRQERETKAAAYKGRSRAELNIDSVKANVIAHWTKDSVILELSSYFDDDAKYLRIDAGGESAFNTREDGRIPKDPEIMLPVKDRLADVTVRIAIGGKTWKKGSLATSKEIRLSPTGVAYDGDTGKQLPSGL